MVWCKLRARFTKLSARYLPLLISACYKVRLTLFSKQDGSGRLTALMVIHVDDCAIAGKKSTVEEIKKAIAKRLSIKDEGRLSKHLGVGYEWNADGGLTMHQKV